MTQIFAKIKHQMKKIKTLMTTLINVVRDDYWIYLTHHPDICKDKTSDEENKKMMTNLVNVARDEVRISDTVKELNTKPEKVYIITNDWN